MNSTIQPRYVARLISIYERGGYGTLIDYQQPPPPPNLSEDNAQWLDNYLHEQAAR